MNFGTFVILRPGRYWLQQAVLAASECWALNPMGDDVSALVPSRSLSKPMELLRLPAPHKTFPQTCLESTFSGKQIEGHGLGSEMGPTLQYEHMNWQPYPFHNNSARHLDISQSHTRHCLNLNTYKFVRHWNPRHGSVSKLGPVTIAQSISMTMSSYEFHENVIEHVKTGSTAHIHLVCLLRFSCCSFHRGSQSASKEKVPVLLNGVSKLSHAIRTGTTIEKSGTYNLISD
ncbi:hypothetical protein C8J56DRAFT_901653 [Mycena floridula]|nr:hypothetical protein C8J56DRAFT_901653 [Mycena floridula]